MKRLEGTWLSVGMAEYGFAVGNCLGTAASYDTPDPVRGWKIRRSDELSRPSRHLENKLQNIARILYAKPSFLERLGIGYRFYPSFHMAERRNEV